MLKRFWVIVLSCAFLLSNLSIGAYASDTSLKFISSLADSSVSRSDYSRIEDELDLMENYFIFAEGVAEITNISKKSAETGSEIWYEIRYDNGIINDICVIENSETRISFRIIQDELSNVLSFAANKISLNGHKVKILSQNSVEIAPASITPRNSDTTFVASCPYGTAGDYMKPLSSNEFDETVNSIVLGQPASTIAYSALSGIMVAALQAVGSIGALSGVFVGVVLAGLYAWLNDSFPNTYGISYAAKLFYHKSCGTLSAGYISGYGSYVTKYDITWYSKYNCNGDKHYDTAYKVHTIY